MYDDIKTSINIDNSFVITSVVKDFLQVAKLAGITLSIDNIDVKYLKAPHKSPGLLPYGKMAVFIFYYGDRCLLVGKAGPNSNARYLSQHYCPNSSNSNLAKTILKDKDNMKIDVNENNVGEWIKINTDRCNILIDANINMTCLDLLKKILQCRLRPRF